MPLMWQLLAIGRGLAMNHAPITPLTCHLEVKGSHLLAFRFEFVSQAEEIVQ